MRIERRRDRTTVSSERAASRKHSIEPSTDSSNTEAPSPPATANHLRTPRTTRSTNDTEGKTMTMKVFLTGATGQLGGAVADVLMAAGHEVLGLARDEDAAATLRSRDIEAVVGDLADVQLVLHRRRGSTV